MFATALIVFRETLEAALFVGIVAAATRGLAGRARWLASGVGAGVLGAVALAAGADKVYPISGATGQGMDKLLDAVIAHLPAATVTERPVGAQEEADETPWSPL